MESQRGLTTDPALLAAEIPRSIVAVVPAFNEERFIAGVVFAALDYADEVLVVDDGSTDRTAAFAERAGATVLRLEVNRGKAAALSRGFQAALQLNPGAVVCLDADAQHDPREIPRVAAPVLNGVADVVIGTRFRSSTSAIPAWRKVGQHTLTAMTNRLSGVSVSDSQSGFRAFSPTATRALRFRSGGLSVESEMQFLFEPAGLRIAEVPISVQYRDGMKRNPFAHGLQVVDAMLGLVARRRPLLFFSLPGFTIVGSGILIGLLVVRRMQQTDHVMIGAVLLTALLVLGGMLLGVTGIMLHSMGQFIDRLGEELDAIARPDVPTNR